MLDDRTTALALISQLIDDRVEADVRIRRSGDSTGCDVLILPTESLVEVSRLIDAQGLNMTFANGEVRVFDPRDRIPDQSVPG